MEMSGFRPELHVAQQSRRDKLRVPQQSSTPSHHLEDFPDNLEQIPVVHSRLNPDLVQVRNVDNANLLYDPAVYSSDMIHFSSKSNVRQEIDATDPFANSSHAHPISSNFNSLPKAPGEPRNWKSHGGSQQGCDWAVNYASGSVGSESNVVPSPVFFGEVNNISGYPHYSKPSHFNEFQDVRSSFKNPSSTQDRQKHFTSSSPLYQNSLQDVVTSASNRTQGLEMVSLVQHNLRGTGRAWPEGGNELALLPAYGNQSDVMCFENAGAWPNRPVENWSGGELGFAARKGSDEELRNVVNTDSNPQGLSLSLSSNPTSKLPQFGEGSCGSVPKPSIISKGSGKSLQDIVGVSTTNTYRNTGPLGPFTGYATILKSSKFLRPAQLLLDEFCGIKSGLKLLKPCEVSERMSGEVSTSGDAMNATETEFGAMGNNSGGSSSTFYSSNEISGDGGVGSSSCESFRPDYQQKKAKLLYMQEEVCRRYKQYHQQMQMVVSSFETVAGLSSATPYISLALKSVSRHFRSLKNAISDQLKHIRRTLGEDLSSPTTGTSSSKVDTSTSRLKYLDQSLQRHKYGGGNVGFLETQHVWRPQRGLPERSVAILRAWLFEHFLHPYPTDTDKHMLATQTGLSRNQVSNWFINARVRVWKPMVEEIHMLETKGVAEANQNSNKNGGNSTAEGSRDKLPNNLSINAMHNKQMECLGMESSLSTGHGLDAEQWNQEKRSRMDCQIPTNMDGSSLMGFVPYQRGGLEIGGLGVGAVSLTLGLRHGTENAQHQHQHQHQQQLQQQEDQLRQQFGGQMIHDFVG